MKKLILAIVLMVFITNHVDAQFRLGLKGGANFEQTKFKNLTGEKPQSATGWQAGLMAQFKIPVIGIGCQPELLYTVKKADKSNSVNYFEVPLHFQYGLDFLVARLYGFAGPYFGYVTNSDVFKNKNNVNKTDVGIGAGFGIDIMRLHFALRYSWGFKDVGYDNHKVKNQTLSLSAGYFFF